MSSQQRSLTLCCWLTLALLTVGAGVPAAYGQTVIIQSARPASTAEFVLNGSVAATGTVGADGLATLAATQSIFANRQSIDVFVWVDDCGTSSRVVVMNRVESPPPVAVGCGRVQIPGLFLLQSVTTFFVDMRVTPATMRVRQGPAPAAWLRPQSPDAPAVRVALAPTGIILFGGGGLSMPGGFTDQVCGDVTSCTSDDRALSATAGVSVWLSQYVGAEASYFRPKRITAEGTGDRFRFDSDMDGGLLVFVGKVGVPVGRLRLFGLGGADYHRATFTTTQTINDTTASNGTVVPGGTQTYQWRTEGWGLTFGGGAEVWLTPAVGIYGEVSRLALKGDDVGGGEARTDQTMTAIIVGGRVRVFGR
jgi:hypothetical protein